ncbi:NACHT domain-containing NTPase [Streptomyces sp. Ru87]|uniref:NACHT domain-containing protein n=2 Tax=unclassified Streptomyces TaxID=2593676 RepID=UPI000BF8A9A0|nr:NACHT domain-containing protein [Streptomyces sp. Ru87]PGH49801.1 ATP-binding protein [Streptomyces sp. Ru87]
MEPAVVGARLASSAVAPLVKKLFVTEGPGAGLVDKPVRVSARLSFRGEKRTLTERDLVKIAAELVRRAVDTGEPPVAPEEERAVVDALAKTLHALGDLDMSDMSAVQLGHRNLSRLLRRTADDPSILLSADASVLYHRLLDTACLHILHFFTQRSDFVARSLVEQARGNAELIAKVDELIARTPRQDMPDVAFERRYAQYVAEKHAKLTIVGLDLSSAEASWPLDTAYLSLQAVRRRDEAGPEGELTGIGFEGELTGLGFEGEPVTTPVDTNRIFTGQDRVLLRGTAGSGKTTLVQWLAVSAARQELPDGMDALRGRVPFVLPLRSVMRAAGLPLPGDFLGAVHNPLHTAQPDGWADRVLRAGRGLLLVDGLDEIPERDRARTRQWLGDLLIAYPGNLWLVTSRHSAVADGWLAGQGFGELVLAPMSRDDVASFVDRWHDAARATCRTAERAAELDRFQAALHIAVRTKRDLGRLVTNPLMCAMVCALHRARNGYLPPGRKELYEEALRMLLTRRDAERDIHAPGDIQLTEEPQIQLLQRLAYWLIRNGRTELDRTRAERIVADALPSVPSAAGQGDAARIFGHLLLRSGLLREPTVGTVEFVHRTFQDYLGAKAVVEEWDVGLLTRNAVDTQWEDVVRMAVAHARPRERAEILRDLLAHGDAAAEAAVRARVHLLATACLEHATELDPGVRRAVEERTAALIPPRTPQQARELAAIGPLVLELLPGPEELTAAEATTVVTTASHIDSDAALSFLSRFRSHPALPVRSQLVWAWPRFDTRRYADEVLAHLGRDDLYFTAPTPAHLSVLRELGGRPRLEIRDRATLDALPAYARATRLTHLTIRNVASLRDVHFLRDLPDPPDLRDLQISDCPSLTDLSALARLPLEYLSLAVLRKCRALPSLRDLHGLKTLLLNAPDVPLRLAGLSPDAPLRTLVVSSVDSGHGGGLRGISAWPTLRRLLLGGLSDAPRSEDEWTELATLPELRQLHIDDRSPARCPADLALPGVESVRLHCSGDGHPDLARVARHFPGLTDLELAPLHGDLSGLDLSPLACLPGLEVVLLPPRTPGLRGTDRLPDAVRVVTRPGLVASPPLRS